MTIALSLLRRRFVAVVAVLLAIVGPLSAMSAEAAGPVNWQAALGHASSNQAIQANFFFPSNFTIDVGDSITWNLDSGEFHTVTFYQGLDRPPLLSGAGPNPVAFFPSPPNGPNDTYVYGGSGYVNSGALGAIPTTSFTVKFTAKGTFRYNCLVHTPMQGWVTVQPAGTPYPHTQAFYNSLASAQETTRISQGYGLAVLGLAKALAAGVGNVTAGIGQFFGTGSLAVVSFLPKVDVIHVGQTVTWSNRDPEFPHTITFNFAALDALGNPFAFFPPMGIPTTGIPNMSSTDQNLNSGFLVKDGPFGTTFRVRFTTAGVYSYRCVLHDDLGMKGTVVVLPGS